MLKYKIYLDEYENWWKWKLVSTFPYSEETIATSAAGHKDKQGCYREINLIRDSNGAPVEVVED